MSTTPERAVSLPIYDTFCIVYIVQTIPYRKSATLISIYFTDTISKKDYHTKPGATSLHGIAQRALPWRVLEYVYSFYIYTTYGEYIFWFVVVLVIDEQCAMLFGFTRIIYIQTNNIKPSVDWKRQSIYMYV